jgi:oxygen-independent coproporphyrinogen-3 oxidase
MMDEYSLYLHIPFCRHRCAYCDFNTYAGLGRLIPEYVSALRREIDLVSEGAARMLRGQKLPVKTIFFGGGTPSLLPVEALEEIMTTLNGCFDLLPDVEVTLEANPGTLSLAYLEALRQSGINRLSLGMQSAHPEELALLERQHDFSDVVRAVTWARQAGFDNLNLDLIFGLPDQSQAAWRSSLDLALGLKPEHLSLYSLTIEHGTPLQHWAARGLISEPDPEAAAEMYEWAMARLGRAGYQQYEISNWARRDREGNLLACRHNLQYWRGLPYLGLGAGAHGYAGGIRTANVLAPSAYIQRMKTGQVQEFPCTPATASIRTVERLDELGETMMMGLRLVEEGVGEGDFSARFGQNLGEVYGAQIERLVGLGLLEWGGERSDRLRLTERGRLLGNQVFVEFI